MSADPQPEAVPQFEGIDSFLNGIRDRVADPLFIDLGCGQATLPEGFIGADRFPARPDIVSADLCKPQQWWPWASGSVDAFTSSHFLEHVASWDWHFSEVYRCLKPGGFYRFVGPYAKSDRYIQDPTHCQPLHENKLAYLNQPWLKANGINHYFAPYNFSVHGVAYAFNKDYELVGKTYGTTEQSPSLTWAMSHLWNVIDDIYVLVRKEPLVEE